MDQAQFQQKLPLLMGWIQQTVAAHASQAKSVGGLGFKRLPGYFSAETLASAKVVVVERVPTPPLSALGLNQFADFERMEFAGITFLNTFFVRRADAGDERLHFHELVHVVQWKLLGPEMFLAFYAAGLERCGYRNSPLEQMAYDLDAKFQADPKPFDVAAVVATVLQRSLTP